MSYKNFCYLRNVCDFRRGESSKLFASVSSSERRISNLFFEIVLIVTNKERVYIWASFFCVLFCLSDFKFNSKAANIMF